MSNTQSSNGHLAKFVAAAYVDLPFAAAERWFSGSSERLRAAGWATYDSAVALANESMNQLYRNPLFAEFFSSSIETGLMARRLLEGETPWDGPLPEPYIEAELPPPHEASAGSRVSGFAATASSDRRSARKRRAAAAA